MSGGHQILGRERTDTKPLERNTFLYRREALYGGLLTVGDAPIIKSKEKYIVHTEPVHPSGTPFRNHKNINGTPLYVDVKVTAKGARRRAKKLLRLYNQDPAGVYLQVAQ